MCDSRFGYSRLEVPRAFRALLAVGIGEGQARRLEDPADRGHAARRARRQPCGWRPLTSGLWAPRRGGRARACAHHTSSFSSSVHSKAVGWAPSPEAPFSPGSGRDFRNLVKKPQKESTRAHLSCDRSHGKLGRGSTALGLLSSYLPPVLRLTTRRRRPTSLPAGSQRSLGPDLPT